MMKNKRKNQVHVLVQELLVYLRRQGYAAQTLSKYESIWKRFIRYSEEQGTLTWSQNLHQEFCDFLGIPLYGQRPSGSYLKGVRTAMRLLDEFTRHRKCKRYGPVPNSRNLTPEHQDIVHAYITYLRNQKELADGTLAHHRRTAERLLCFVQAKVGNLIQMKPQHIMEYLKSIPDVTREVRAGQCNRLRCFFEYLEIYQYLSHCLSEAVPSACLYRDRRIPSAWPASLVESLINHIDRRDALGKRNFVIVLLAARYGIRSGDIAHLCLDDIHWSSEEIVFTQQKTRYPIQLPLIEEIGQAIIDYIKNGRPNSSSRELLLRSIAPALPLTSRGMSSVLPCLLRQTGIKLPPDCRANLRSLRGSVATQMLNAQIPTETISAMLGHQHIESTKHYFKVDTEHLRAICLNPEGLQ
jgi:site-specific recombinase XerD